MRNAQQLANNLLGLLTHRKILILKVKFPSDNHPSPESNQCPYRFAIPNQNLITANKDNSSYVQAKKELALPILQVLKT